MKKIPCVFRREFGNKRLVRGSEGRIQVETLLEEVTPGCEWVLAGEGVATRKWDGTACLVRGGNLYKRYDAKGGKQPPPGFEPAQDPDPVTKHWPGWLQVDVLNPDPADVWHALAWWQSTALPRGTAGPHLPHVPSRASEGTYELIGPRISSNYEGASQLTFVRHGVNVLLGASRTFSALRDFLAERNIEGIVFWREPGNPNSDMAKITRENFGLPWPR